MKKIFLLSLNLIFCTGAIAQVQDTLTFGNYYLCDVDPQLWDSRRLDSFFNETPSSLLICSLSNNNDKAVEIFKNRLTLIETYIKGEFEEIERSEKYFTRVMFSLYNFEYVTDIESESDGNYIGKTNPTTNDLENWNRWLSENKGKLCYYEPLNILYLKNEFTICDE